MKTLSKMKTYSRKNSSYLKKAFIASNFNEMCRLCLSEVDMVLTPIIQDNKSSYQEWIQYSVDVMVEEGDGLPPNICEECLAMVEQTYLFKKKCKSSDSKLREHLELLEMNEEGKNNFTSFDESNEDHNNLFTKENPNKYKCDESSSVDSGGTEPQSPEPKNSNTEPSFEALDKSNEVQNSTTPKENANISLETTNKNQNEEMRLEEDDEEEEEEEEEMEEENEIELKEPKYPKIISKVQRYILKGEKREGEQEEDLTECEVVPLDVENDSKDQNGHVTDTRIQEIFKLWDNEEETEENLEVVEVPAQKKEKKTVEQNGERNDTVQTNNLFSNKIHIANITLKTIPVSKYKSFESGLNNSTRQHIVKEQMSDAAYCDICGKSFTCTNSLKRHMSVHTGFKPYKCETCGREFSQGSILKRHILTHEVLKPYNCHLCPKGYTQKMNLLAHLKTHGYKTGAESYQCKVCSKSFVHQSGLSRHLRLHKGIRFLCEFCSRSFADASALSRHVKSVHHHQF